MIRVMGRQERVLFSRGIRRPWESELQSVLPTTMDALSFLDLWRLSHPTDTEYTQISGVHGSISYIDYIFGSPPAVALMTDT